MDDSSEPTWDATAMPESVRVMDVRVAELVVEMLHDAIEAAASADGMLSVDLDAIIDRALQATEDHRS